ncbi:hypothetical protein BDW02DRAFT_606224 [Decorospora gaudefroyi]|uniref:Uncharacterized protein n=1 Tax=Decorospora gaudefroyi TaxID=184978 RepID=A0A6A5K3W5_9PLEO|nr:hypothetical protein BDW02DRAFT_606224 [Decorospora gaudefroyi]
MLYYSTRAQWLLTQNFRENWRSHWARVEQILYMFRSQPAMTVSTSTASLDAPHTHTHTIQWCKKMAKTYNSGDSLVVTHLTTSPPVHCLYIAEQTGSIIFSVLWSYVKGWSVFT